MWSRAALCGCGGQPPDMVTLNIYPQDCSLHFSIYCRHEQVALIGGFPTADVLANCAFNSNAALDSNWLALVSALGFEICRFSDNWALVCESVKATSFFFFLGVGGFVCYKLYHHYWPKNPPDSPRNAKRSIFTSTGKTLKNLYQTRRHLLESGEEAPYGSVQSNYFGPDTSCDDADYADRYNCISLSQSEDDESIYSESHLRDRRSASKRCRNGFRSMWGGRRASQTHTREAANKGWLLSSINGSIPPLSNPIQVQKKGASWPVTPCKGDDKPNLKKAQSYLNFAERMAPDGAESSSLEGSYPCYPSLPRDFSVDSLGFSLSDYEKHGSKFHREGSFESTCSDFSIEWSVKETDDSATVACLEKLQQEIDQLKNNCLLMDEDFETIKCNRNVPGMSSLMTEAPNEESERKACFAGLYSLTCINKSISSELSDMALINCSQGSEQAKQLDSPIAAATQQMHIGRGYYLPSQEQQMSLGSAFSEEDELMAHLEWDEDLDQQPLFEERDDDAGDEKLNCVASLELDLEAELSGQDLNLDNNENPTQSLQSVQAETKKPELKLLNLQPPNLLQWSSEESGFMEWDTSSESHRTLSDSSLLSRSWMSGAKTSELVTPESDAFLTPSSELPTPSDVSPPLQPNIGDREQILEYALREWHGNTLKAQRMLKGYSEVSGVVGKQYIRRIRGDNYCAVRAALFQCLSTNLPVPKGDATFAALAKAVGSGSSWIQDWQFAGRLPYRGNNVLHGMKQCLDSLDNVSTLLSETTNRESLLVNMLNANASLDLHLLEAVKLHMMATALKIHEQSVTCPDELPLFAMLMFARDTSENPRDFMNNHLQVVGNSGGLEQVEMFLLSHTLRVNIKVVRPNSFGTEDFVCSFGKEETTPSEPSIVLIAEDDRHYNVLL
ncbi:Hypothetical predicted protein [Cloeon dipterum]|uniref:Uncharacterized protein n=2 Tax=Cloeon dipterum TaxID=197152 RepID=A0A8S1E7I2_9INSE|nr:Hypothetical predicted protein [Cloeon dipterum]